MAQTPQKDAEAGTKTEQTTAQSKETGVKTIPARVFTDFAAI
ncbi:MAG: hypothetical protein AAFZ10_08955 [Pseudomonadota bacterium]